MSLAPIVTLRASQVSDMPTYAPVCPPGKSGPTITTSSRPSVQNQSIRSGRVTSQIPVCRERQATTPLRNKAAKRIRKGRPGVGSVWSASMTGKKRAVGTAQSRSGPLWWHIRCVEGRRSVRCASQDPNRKSRLIICAAPNSARLNPLDSNRLLDDNDAI